MAKYETDLIGPDQSHWTKLIQGSIGYNTKESTSYLWRGIQTNRFIYYH